MATKEDILEQVVEEYLIHKGYFVQHNVKFKPSPSHIEFISNKDSNNSDIDVLGIHPLLEGRDRVWAVSCKSWQGGFDPTARLSAIEQNKIQSGREAWKGFRELVIPKWSEAFAQRIKETTGSTEFTHVTAVTHLRGSAETWENYELFSKNLPNAKIKVLTFKEMIDEIRGGLTTTLAGTEVGRMLQLFSASGFFRNG